MIKWLFPLWAACIATPALGDVLLSAAGYPARAITITVAAAAGGVTDVVARAIGQRLSQSWGQQVLIENKGGAAHVVGAQSVARAAPDGYSLLLAEAGAFVINPTLYGTGKLPYDQDNDFAPVTGIIRINQALLGNPSVAADSASDLISLASSNPGKLTYGTAGMGSAPHMNMVLFESMAGIELVPVHYRGAAPALTDVIAGHVDLMCVSVSLALPAWHAGQVKIFGIGSRQRLPAAPGIPTVAESALAGFEATTWFGLFAPAGTAAGIVRKINSEVAKILADPEFQRTFLAPQVFEPMASSPEAFAVYIRQESQKWGELIRARNLTIAK